ncbi:soluble epoxide hydrolase [Aureobasidium pullulans]|uniref:Soluble epoxide hydrolase n=1 Tax=Aureobasidium pullulans TaxID=5580 RepID=A0AB74ITV9_AURPU|nr:soluble epoxide hydrolase [Aureobasidium pullulans]
MAWFAFTAWCKSTLVSFALLFLLHVQSQVAATQTPHRVMEIYDHTGQPVIHGRARVNGIRMHYVHAGQGPESLLLLHGTPKTSYYWYKLFPLLTQHFHVIAPDLRGFGDTDKPPTTDGYDSATNSQDVSELMTLLNIDKFHVHGEDRGADFAYALAATCRDRVKSLSFCEMAVSGFGLEETSYWTEENLTAQYRQKGIWCWHLGFFSIPHIPEMLIQGHEREFWEMFMKQECYNPNAIEHAALDHWVACSMQPGGLRGILETYRAGFKNAANHRALLEAGGKLKVRTMTIGAPEFFGPIVEQSISRVVERVERSEILEECGHSLALEKPERLAKCLREFMLGVD